MLKINPVYILRLAVLASAVFLSSCGGGSKSKNDVVSPDDNGDTNNPVDGARQFKEVLPYDLDKNNGHIAFAFVIQAGAAILSPVIQGANFPAEEVNPPIGDDVQLESLILISEFIKPECENSGGFTHTDNTPSIPYMFLDQTDDVGSWPNTIMNEYSVTNCDLDLGRYADGFYRGIAVNKDKELSNEEEYLNWAITSYSHEYKKLAGLRGLTGSDLRAKLYDISGSAMTKQISRDDRVTTVTNSAPWVKFTHKSGHEAVLENLQYEGIFTDNADSIVEKYSYQLTWNMVETKRYPIISPNTAILAGLSGKKDRTFPKGSYRLKAVVTSPIRYGKDENGGLLVKEGAASIDLLSHNMRADIVYSPGYADVTYSRNTGVTTVKYNMRTFSVE